MVKIMNVRVLVLIVITVCAVSLAQGRKAAQQQSKTPSAAAQTPAAAAGQSKPASAAKPVKSTSADRRSVEVTVYNSDIGLVKERRKVKVAAGEGELRFADVAAQINPVTVLVKPLDGAAANFAVLEQNYEYDLISHAKLMDKYVGKKIKIVDWNEYQDRKTTVEAELLSVNAGEVYKIGNEIYLGHPGTKVLPELPGNLISRPTLSWIYRSKSGGDLQLEVSYMTRGMNWNADYILTVADGKPAGLSGWVTLNNQSGAAYENAKLKLVAGEVNRVRDQGMSKMRVQNEAMMMDAAAPVYGAGFAQSEVFEYYMYDLERPTTIKENQTKQINLLEAQGVTVVKEYVTSQSNVHFRRGGGGETADGAVKQPVVAYFSFKNSKENKLGDAIPAGTVRMYTADVKGSMQFIGEDRVSHTPKDEDIRLKVGEVFDIVAERKQTDYKQITSRQHEASIEISLRNRKNEDVTVTVQENASSASWEITQSSHKHVKMNATTFKFDVSVGKGKEVVVKYKIRNGF